MKTSKVNIFNSVKFQKSKNCQIITHAETFKTSYHSTKSDNPIKSYEWFCWNKFPKEGKKWALLTHFAMRFLGTPWNQKIKMYAKVSIMASTLRGYTFGGILRGCVLNHAEIFCFAQERINWISY